MSPTPDMDPVNRLRHCSPEELVQLGEDSLKQRLLEQAVAAHQKYGPLGPENLAAFLGDPDCVRYPTRLVFEFGEMAPHQFAQPDIDYGNAEEEGRVLYLRPSLQARPDLIALAVAYMLPAINYGDIIADEHCLLYGAALLGLMQDEFYQKICALADLVGAEVRLPEGAPGSTPPRSPFPGHSDTQTGERQEQVRPPTQFPSHHHPVQ